MRSLPVPAPLRRTVRVVAAMACDCSSSSRSPSGSSWLRNSSKPNQRIRVRVPPAIRKKSTLASIRSHANVGEPPDYQDAYDLGNDGVGEELGTDRVGPQQADVFRLQDPEAQTDDKRQGAEEARRKALLGGVSAELGGHIEALAHQ